MAGPSPVAALAGDDLDGDVGVLLRLHREGDLLDRRRHADVRDRRERLPVEAALGVLPHGQPPSGGHAHGADSVRGSTRRPITPTRSPVSREKSAWSSSATWPNARCADDREITAMMNPDCGPVHSGRIDERRQHCTDRWPWAPNFALNLGYNCARFTTPAPFAGRPIAESQSPLRSTMDSAHAS